MTALITTEKRKGQCYYNRNISVALYFAPTVINVIKLTDD
jgi:hypothetical protein